MDLGIFIIGFLTLCVSVVTLIVFVIKKKPKKKAAIALATGLVLMIAGVSMKDTVPNDIEDVESEPVISEEEEEDEPEPEPVKYTEEEIAILGKSYNDLTDEEKEMLKGIDIKFIGLSDEDKSKYESDLNRLLKEKEGAEWEEHAKENTKELIAGEHKVGEHIEAGPYNVTFSGSGNFIIHSSEGSLFTNEVAGTSRGINKYRSILVEGSTIELKGTAATFTPAKVDKLPYEEIELYSGYWVVGNDLTEGRYKAKVIEGSGNFVIHSSNNQLKTNEILGGSIGVEEVVVNLEDNDLIQISGMDKVQFIPEN